MAVTTCGDLITLALRTAGVNGVGQTPIAEDFQDCMFLLSSMVAGWQRKRWLVPSLTDYALTSTGAIAYTVGPAGDFPIPRPDRIESAFIRLIGSPTSIDFPIGIIEAHEDYNLIPAKTIQGIPSGVFYDSAFPVGSVYFWPVPPSGLYQLHLTVKAALPTYATVTDPLNLPPEYREALLYGLVLRIAMNYGQDPRPAHAAAYRQATNVIRMANVQVAVLGMPSGLRGRIRGGSSLGGATGPNTFNAPLDQFVLDTNVLL